MLSIMNKDSICTIFGHSKITPVTWYWSLYQACASSTTSWQINQYVPKHWPGSSKFVPFREPSLVKQLCHADCIFFVFYSDTLVKHATHRCFLQRHIQTQSWNSHAMQTVIDIDTSHTTIEQMLKTINQCTTFYQSFHLLSTETLTFFEFISQINHLFYSIYTAIQFTTSFIPYW